MDSIVDLNWRYYDATSPLSFSNEVADTGSDDKLLPPLPEKSANKKEIDAHEYYFKFADDAKNKLQTRDLWIKKEGTDTYSAEPDAGERLKSAFSSFLTSFVSLGSSTESANPDDRLPGIAFSSQVVMAPITGSIFIFNTIVSLLKKAFPSQKSYLDQAGKLSYFSASTVHSAVSAVLPVVSELRSSHIDPVFSIVLVSIELLLGFYATVTATEAVIARQGKKSEILTKLINAKAGAQSFFEKARAGEKADASEASDYQTFMASISKLDKLSGESRFGGQIAATATTKEWLWFGGAVIGNETAYRNLDTTHIGVSGPELLGTTLSEMAMSLVANVTDLIHGVVVACRSESNAGYKFALTQGLKKLSTELEIPAMRSVIDGISRIIHKKIQDDKFEQGFSNFRIFKAAVLVTIGIVGIVALVLKLTLAAPWILGLAAGLVLAAFFIFLIARVLRASDSARDKEQKEEVSKTQIKSWGNERLNEREAPAGLAENEFILLRALSVYLVDMPALWQEGGHLNSVFKALNFQEIETALLRSFVIEGRNREENIGMVNTQLTRMLELKLAGA